MTDPEINNAAAEKLELYKVARQLFNDSMSYPQIVELFVEKNFQRDIAEQVVEAAFHEKWDRLFDLAKDCYAQGKTYEEVVHLLKSNEGDEEIARYIADTWYEVKTVEMESIVESPGNIYEGLKWVVISGIVVPVMFMLNTSLISKIIWIVVFAGASIQYLWGLRQRRLAKDIKKYMEDEENK